MVGLLTLCIALSLSADNFFLMVPGISIAWFLAPAGTSIGWFQKADLRVDAATTQTPHEHHEHTEMENVSFQYDGASQLMMVIAGTKCYIWTLTSDQLQNVHTDDGLRTIELKILGDIDNAMFTVVPKAILASGIQHACARGKHVDSFYLVH